MENSGYMPAMSFFTDFPSLLYLDYKGDWNGGGEIGLRGGLIEKKRESLGPKSF